MSFDFILINDTNQSFRYVYKLHDLQLSAENFVEAGFTLKLYADMLSWNKEILTFAPNETAGEPEWQRKEKLYHTVRIYLKFLGFMKTLLISNVIISDNPVF